MKERFLMMTSFRPNVLHKELAYRRDIELVYRGLPENPFTFQHTEIGEGFSGVVTDHPGLVANLLPHIDVAIFEYVESIGPVVDCQGKAQNIKMRQLASLYIYRPWRCRADLLTNQTF